MVNGLEYFYCKHCICKNTQRKGFFTHTSTATATTSYHTFSCSDDATTATADETASLLISGSSSISSLGYVSAPGCSLGSVTAAKVKSTAMNPVDENRVDTDPDGLEFIGAYFADVSTNDAA